MNPDAYRENLRVVMFGKMAIVREMLLEMGDIEIIEYEDAAAFAFGYCMGTEDADMILVYAPYAEGLLYCSLMAGERKCPVRLLPEHPCEAARFELRFTLEEIKKKRKSISSRGSWPAANEEAEYGK